jgi:hypothetical protein
MSGSRFDWLELRPPKRIPGSSTALAPPPEKTPMPPRTKWGMLGLRQWLSTTDGPCRGARRICGFRCDLRWHMVVVCLPVVLLVTPPLRVFLCMLS